MNRLFVVDKPIFRSSNGYMGHIKHKYGTKKVGFSGTLDPFATGCLIVATGKYTKLFQYLAKTPKTYRATLWLGASSASFDIENVESIEDISPMEESEIMQVLDSLHGELTYLPPKYSAKMIDGRRAYDLAREGKDVQMKQVTSTIHEIKLIHYNHPFVHFEATVSEGTYIRSLGQMIAQELGVPGTLSSLHRVREGNFYFDGERAMDPFKHLYIPRNRLAGDERDIELGKKLTRERFEIQDDGVYLVETDAYFTIIEITDDKVSYRLNQIPKFSS